MSTRTEPWESRRFGTPRRDDQPAEHPEGASDLFRLYGRRPVWEALQQGIVRSLTMSRRAHGRIIDQIKSRAAELHIPIEWAETLPNEEDAVTQGVRAFVEPPIVRTDLKTFLNDLPESPHPLILMLDGITDPHNFGAILRSADAAGVTAVIIREHRQAPLTDVVIKVSAGGAFFLPIFEVKNLDQTLRLLTELGYWSAAAVADEKAVLYNQYRWDSKTVLIVGSEGAGVSDLIKRRADTLIAIPMFGHVESLNVSVATALLLYASVDKRFNMIKK